MIPMTCLQLIAERLFDGTNRLGNDAVIAHRIASDGIFRVGNAKENDCPNGACAK